VDFHIHTNHKSDTDLKKTRIHRRHGRRALDRYFLFPPR
jgi:hypothetical protein